MSLLVRKIEKAKWMQNNAIGRGRLQMGDLHESLRKNL